MAWIRLLEENAAAGEEVVEGLEVQPLPNVGDRIAIHRPEGEVIDFEVLGRTFEVVVEEDGDTVSEERVTPPRQSLLTDLGVSLWKRPMRLFLPVILLLASPAFAASPEAWDEFRQRVHDVCLSLVPTTEGAEIAIEVDPFGSEHYGVALIHSTYSESTDTMVCIYDKASGAAEISGPFVLVRREPG